MAELAGSTLFRANSAQAYQGSAGADPYFTEENAVGTSNWLAMLATI